ncbi:MAG TPA: M48 family metalloprotease [Acidimicrobiales bacterium]|nr:M48 family metalloprotease [Acidimicrobiales bacterium]
MASAKANQAHRASKTPAPGTRGRSRAVTPVRAATLPAEPPALARAGLTAPARLAAGAPVLLIVAGAALAATSPLPTVTRVIGVVLGALGLALALADYLAGSTRRLVRALGTRPADPTREARLINLTEGLCLGFGLSEPQVLVIDDVAPNALMLARRARSARLIITTGALELLDRMQLEAVLAHELAHLKRGDAAAAAVAMRAFGFAALVSPWGARLAERGVATEREALADRAAMNVTRYPPALADALEAFAEAPRVRPASLPPAVARITAWQWCAPFARRPSDRSRSGELDLALRIAALREL